MSNPSKTRFQPAGGKSRSVSKAGGVSNGSGSRRVNTVVATQPGKVTSSNLQVIFNGKIVTPQSLLPRKASIQKDKKFRRPSASMVPQEETISELPEKSSLSMLPGKLGGFSSKDIQGTTERMGLRKYTRPDMSPEKVEEKIVVTLTECPTETLIMLPSLVISNETREVVAIEERNSKYEALVDAHKNSDGFTARQTQTSNNFQKNQNDMAAPNASQEFGCQAISYDISDALARLSAFEEPDSFTNTNVDEAANELTAGLTPYVAKFVKDTVGVAVATPGCLLNVNDLTKPPDPQEVVKKDTNKGGGGGMRGQRSLGMGTSRITSTNITSSNQNTEEDSRPSNSGIGMSTNFVGGEDDSEGDRSDRGKHSGSGEQSGQMFSGGQGSGGGAPAPDVQQLLREREAAAILESKSLLRKLQLTERTVLQNIYHRQHLYYRDLPDVEPLKLTTKENTEVVDSTDQLFGSLGIGGIGMTLGGVGTLGGFGGAGPGMLGRRQGSFRTRVTKEGQGSAEAGNDAEGEEEDPNSLPKLFCYRAESVVRGRPVTAMAWNPANADLLAVGYGRVDFSLDGGQKPAKGIAVDEELNGGLVLFWSLRNPEHPEKVLRTAHPVTSLDFSIRSPTLLALGLYNGDVDVYDVRRENDWGKPVQSSGGMEGGHTDPVWQVRWIRKGQEQIETLVSISTDGRVLEWNLKKGLVVTTLMVLKRGGAGEGWISRQAAGLCCDFVPGDSSTYVVGTEEGQVHRCSVSYNEQYLDTYEPHNGPVYRVRFSTRWPDVFLTSSADWTMGLYHIRSSSSRGPLLKLHCTGQEFGVSDICWSRGNSTVFAAVTRDAKLQIWDLSVSAIDPVINFDTNEESEQEAAALAAAANNKSASTMIAGSKPGSAADFNLTGTSGANRRLGTGNSTLGVARREDREKEEFEKNESPVSKLVRNLAQNGNRRSLTSVLFGEKSPIVVVGDSVGAVTVYRVTKPVLFTHEGPVQQAQKLREAVLRQSDPLDAAKLSTTMNAPSENGHANGISSDHK